MKLEELQRHILEHRRYLHSIPEVGSDLPETAAYIARQLELLGVPYRKSPVDSGIVALIEGRGPGRCIALRADMDALMVQEETGLPFASRYPGRMHACGHDCHAAMLLGAAQILMGKRDQFCGTVKLLFQANEEACLGARQMIADGALKNPDVEGVVSLHVGTLAPSLKTGQIGIFAGNIMAASDRFDIYVKGKGGHGSAPNTAVNPINVAAQIVSTLHTVISTETNVFAPRVLTVCGIASTDSVTYNVIPETVRVWGTVRTTDPVTHDLIIKRLEEISTGVAKSMRAEAAVNVVMTTPVLGNDAHMAAIAVEAARTFLPESQIVTSPIPQAMGSEDAAFYHAEVPGIYCMLGTANPEKHTDIPNHNCRFDVDEDVLWEGGMLYAACALRFLKS